VNRPPEFDAERFLDAIHRGPYGEQMRDASWRRSQLYDMLSGSRDPLWREIGEQLRSGVMTLSDILRVESYRQHMFEGLAANGDAFVEGMRDIQQELERQADEHERRDRD